VPDLADSLIDQFVLESAESLSDASDALLELEKNRNDPDAVDRLFRALHTLKGNAALFDLQPIVAVAHIAEDILDTIRKGQQEMSGPLADVIFSMIDQIATWVTAIERNNKLPADAASVSDELQARLREYSLHEIKPGPSSQADFSWADSMPAHAWMDISKQGQPSVAVLYTPDKGCFFSGDDPLQIMRELPGLCALQTSFRQAPPSLSDLETYTCHLKFMALSSAPMAEVAAYCRDYKDQIAIRASGPHEAEPTQEIQDTASFRQIITAQLRILELPDLLDGSKARLNAALQNIGNALRYMKREDALEQFARLQHNITELQDVAELRRFVATLLDPQIEQQTADVPAQQPETGRKFLQIEQGRIDQLLNLISEMAAAKNNLQYLAERAESVSREFAVELKDRAALVERITQEMQDIVVNFRMTPLSSIFKRLPRLVRDLSKELNRKVRLTIEGGETEADRHVIDTLSEPLLHMLRNSMAHGIEPSEERAAAGKNPTGSIRIKAYHHNNQLIIEVQDDGRGIPAQKIKEKAAASGIISAEEAERMSDADALQLIFHSGFSTAEQVTSLSGRGVGMDVVKSTVENAGGRITVHSEVGVGTRFTLALPLFIAAAQMMTVRVADQLFGIPMQQVQQSLKIPRKSIRKIKKTETFVYRDNILPLLRLHALLDVPATEQDELAIMIVRLHHGLVGLAVDDFSNPVEVVIKPLSGILKTVSNFSGSALLADGSVLLVLNLEELMHGH